MAESNQGKIHHEEQYGQPPAYYPPAQPVMVAGNGYMHQQPPTVFQTTQYNGTTVIGVQPTRIPDTVIVTQPQIYAVLQPPNYLCLSCLTFWCFNCLFGLIAFCFSLMSSSAFGEGKIEQARTHGRVALYLNIAGMIMTAILITVLLILCL